MRNIVKNAIALLFVVLVFNSFANATFMTCLRGGTLVNCKEWIKTATNCYCTDKTGTDCYGYEIEATGYQQIKCSLEVE